MSQQDTADVLFAGATRPSMVFGVTLEFLLVNVMLAMMVFIGTGNPLYVCIALPGHVIGYFVCLKEPRQFIIFFTFLTTMAKCRNRAFWKGSTYTPQ